MDVSTHPLASAFVADLLPAWRELTFLKSLPLPVHVLLARALVVAGYPIDVEVLEHATWDDLEFWLGQPAEPDAAGGGRVALRAVDPGDIPHLYHASLDPANSMQWRFRGQTMNPRDFENGLHDGVLCQFAAYERRTKRLLGLTIAYNADLVNGYAYLGILRSAEPGDQSRGGMIEAAFLLFTHVFDAFPLRRVYMEVPDYNRFLVDGLIEAGVLDRVAILPAHLRHAGRFADLQIVAIQSNRWRTIGGRLRGRNLRQGDDQP